MISIIVAIAENNAIGYNNKLIYWLPNDLKRFKALTTGCTIIMGRKTFESLPKGALPNRRNIVVSHTKKENAFPGAECYPTLELAIEKAKNGYLYNNEKSYEIYIIGGASIYKQALQYAERLCLTYVFDTPENADTFFPKWNKEEWEEVFYEEHEKDERHNQRYAFIDLVRKNQKNKFHS